MFGHKNKETDERERREYYAAAAKRFALDAKMFRCRAAVHVENKDDIGFWNTVLKHFVPEGRFHFIAGSRNEYGRETFGVTQCLKYFDFLSPGFFICIDSDYRYLLGERQINAGHFVLQTYTYSFEKPEHSRKHISRQAKPPQNFSVLLVLYKWKHSLLFSRYPLHT